MIEACSTDVKDLERPGRRRQPFAEVGKISLYSAEMVDCAGFVRVAAPATRVHRACATPVVAGRGKENRRRYGAIGAHGG
jgi:hypothetical protein